MIFFKNWKIIYIYLVLRNILKNYENLEYFITDEVVKLDVRKLETVSFSFTGYYKIFVDDYSKIIKRMSKLNSST